MSRDLANTALAILTHSVQMNVSSFFNLASLLSRFVHPQKLQYFVVITRPFAQVSRSLPLIAGLGFALSL